MKNFNEFIGIQEAATGLKPPINEVSQKLALSTANKRLKQGVAWRIAQSTVNPYADAAGKRLYRSLGKRAEDSHAKARKSYEYAFNKGVAKGEKLAKEEVQLDELKGSTLKSYIRKSYGDISHQSGMVAHLKVKKYKHPWLKQASADQLKVHTRKEKNRGEGIDRAVTKLGEEVQLDEMMTRKHFQQVADVIKSHPDAAKRAELAKHHAAIFKASNPRFDHQRFYSAANVVVKEASDWAGDRIGPILSKPSTRLQKPKLKKYRVTSKSLGMTKVKGALGGTYHESTENPAQDATSAKYQVGHTVTPKIGPHKGTKHTVIHVHPDGSYNIKPDVHASLNKYRQGATRAQEKDLK